MKDREYQTVFATHDRNGITYEQGTEDILLKTTKDLKTSVLYQRKFLKVILSNSS
jgi:hypothetical protein